MYNAAGLNLERYSSMVWRDVQFSLTHLIYMTSQAKITSQTLVPKTRYRPCLVMWTQTATNNKPYFHTEQKGMSRTLLVWQNKHCRLRGYSHSPAAVSTYFSPPSSVKKCINWCKVTMTLDFDFSVSKVGKSTTLDTISLHTEKQKQPGHSSVSAAVK